MKSSISFLNTSTAKDINIGRKMNKLSDNLYSNHFNDSSALSIALQPQVSKKIKANTIHKKQYRHRKSMSEDFVTHLVARELSNNPELAVHCKRGVINAIPKIKEAIKANQGIEINLLKAYINSSRAKNKLPMLLALTKSGVLTFDNSTDSIVRAGAVNIPRQNRIRFLTAREQASINYHKTSKYCGLYNNQLAITRFSTEIINSLSHSHKTYKGERLLSWLVKNHKIKAEEYNNGNLLNDRFDFGSVSAETLAEAVLQGSIEKDVILKSCSKKKIQEINAIIQNYCI